MSYIFPSSPASSNNAIVATTTPPLEKIVDVVNVPSSCLGRNLFARIGAIVLDTRVGKRAANEKTGIVIEAIVDDIEILDAYVDRIDTTNRFVVRYPCRRLLPRVGTRFVDARVVRVYESQGAIVKLLDDYVVAFCGVDDAIVIKRREQEEEEEEGDDAHYFQCAYCAAAQNVAIERFVVGSSINVVLTFVEFVDGKFVCSARHDCGDSIVPRRPSECRDDATSARLS